MLPIQLCYDGVPATLPPALDVFDVFTDITFFADIILNFRVGYIENAQIVVDKKMIRRKYLSKWFTIDLIGSFPGDTIFIIYEAAAAGGGENVGDNTQILNLFKVLKIPKLLRLGRLFKSLEKLEGAANVANIFILLLIMVVTNHWVSCLWYLVTKGGDGWVAANFDTIDADGNVIVLPWAQQYPKTFYTTLMMVMGDSIDQSGNLAEYIISSMIVVLGILMNATIFASIASYASQISAETATHKNKMNSVMVYTDMGLPDHLADRVKQYYEYCWSAHRDFSAQVLMDELPAVFQRRCAMAVHEEKLRRFGPFSQADDNFVAALTTKRGVYITDTSW